jgi:hypothetical protein
MYGVQGMLKPKILVIFVVAKNFILSITSSEMLGPFVSTIAIAIWLNFVQFPEVGLCHVTQWK